MTQFKPGDIVQSRSVKCIYTLGECGYIHHGSGKFLTYGSGCPLEFFTSDNFVKLNVTEAPEEFGPGDLVRDKCNPEWVFALGDTGYVALPSGRVYPYAENPFTSENYERYEKVEL